MWNYLPDEIERLLARLPGGDTAGKIRDVAAPPRLPVLKNHHVSHRLRQPEVMGVPGGAGGSWKPSRSTRSPSGSGKSNENFVGG